MLLFLLTKNMARVHSMAQRPLLCQSYPAVTRCLRTYNNEMKIPHNIATNLNPPVDYRSLQINMVQQFPAATTVHHSRRKRQNFVTVIVPRKEYDTQGAINDQTIP